MAESRPGPRIHKSPQVLRELAANNGLSGVQSVRVQELITGKSAAVAGVTNTVESKAGAISEALIRRHPRVGADPAAGTHAATEFEVVPDPGAADADPET